MAQVNAESHTMHLEKTHESGAEEWSCPVCGRRFIVQWPPAFKKIILNPGNEYVLHDGGNGGIVMGKPQVQERKAVEPVLAPVWLEAIAALNFGD